MSGVFTGYNQYMTVILIIGFTCFLWLGLIIGCYDAKMIALFMWLAFFFFFPFFDDFSAQVLELVLHLTPIVKMVIIYHIDDFTV